MNEAAFRNWLEEKKKTKKVQGDIVSRLKRIEREIDNCDIDDHYDNDRCTFLLALFDKRGENEQMKKYPHADFPIGKSHMSTFRHALNNYVNFRDESL